MRQVALLVWLFLSHGVVFALGMGAFDAGKPWLAALLLVAVPAWRVYRRFREPRGYYLLGYGSPAGGDIHYLGGWISRKSAPARFTLCLACEIFVIAYLAVVGLIGPRLFPVSAHSPEGREPKYRIARLRPTAYDPVLWE